MKLLHAAVLLLLVPACASTTRWQPEPKSDPRNLHRFTRFPDVTEVKISRDGTYAAVLATPQGASRLVFVRTADRAKVGGFDISEEDAVISFEWANDNRVVLELGQKPGGPLEPPSYTGELLAVDVDGGNPRMIFGGNNRATVYAVAYNGGEAAIEMGRVLGPVPTDPSQILVRSRDLIVDRISGGRLRFRSATKAYVYSVNVTNGNAKLIADAPDPYSWFVADETGALRFATHYDDDEKLLVFELDSAAAEWKRARDLSIKAKQIIPVGVSKKHDLLYVTGEDDGGSAVFGVELGTGKHRALARNKEVEPKSMIFDPRDGALVAVEFEPNYPSWTVLEKQRGPERIIAGILEKYPGHRVVISSLTATGTQAVARISSDRMPGLYVVADAAGTVTPLVSENESIRPAEMLPTEAFLLKASDGIVLHGYLTLPRGGEKSPQPLIVMPHGGPHYVRDVWEFDPEVQAFAAAGYAVLRVNFRGSSGFGTQFANAARGKWGDRVIDDILDAVRWAIAERLADPKRICIVGTSFGGYAAMQSSIRAPELFQCAVGIAGVYDLDLLFEEGDVQEGKSGRKYLESTVGTDPKIRAAMSPAKNADKLRVPVLLIHGEQDARAPISHAEAMCDAIEEQERVCEKRYFSEEGHGFWNEKNRYDATLSALEFVDRHLQPRR